MKHLIYFEYLRPFLNLNECIKTYCKNTISLALKIWKNFHFLNSMFEPSLIDITVPEDKSQAKRTGKDR